MGLTYQVVEFENLGDLEKEVNRLIALGWKPWGGVSVSGIVSSKILMIYCQAMVQER